MANNTEDTLRELYYEPGLPTTYSGVNRLWKAAHSVNKAITKDMVEEWLQAQDTYTLHTVARKKLSAEPRVHVSRIDEQWAMDLCDVTNIRRHNNGCNFILTTIDILSKWANAEPVMRKTAADTTRALENIFARTTRRPQRIETDQGKEFYNATFAALCARENIHHFSSQSSNKACVAERFNRSLKSLMYKHFTAENTLRWMDVLPDLLKTYNNRVHRSIGMSPNTVVAENELQVYRTLYRKRPKKGKLLAVGDMVRISKKKQVFDKGYLPNYTEEVFKIARVVDGHTPYRYELEDLMDEKIVGRFAPEEIQKTIKGDDDVWKIEKVIRRVKRPGGRYQLYVKWRGFPNKFNSFVDEDDVVPIAQQ